MKASSRSYGSYSPLSQLVNVEDHARRSHKHGKSLKINEIKHKKLFKLFYLSKSFLIGFPMKQFGLTRSWYYGINRCLDCDRVGYCVLVAII